MSVFPSSPTSDQFGPHRKNSDVRPWLQGHIASPWSGNFSIKAGINSAEGTEDSSLAYRMGVVDISPRGTKKKAYLGVSSRVKCPETSSPVQLEFRSHWYESVILN